MSTSAMSGPYLHAPTDVKSGSVGKRLSKRNHSHSMLTALNTSASTSTLNSNRPLRPSPASSRSDNLLSPVDVPRSPLDPRQQSKASLATDSGSEERPGGVRKKLSLTGTMLGKKPSMRLALGSQRSLSDASLAESPEERDRMLSEIKLKAEKDRSIAHNHAVSCGSLGVPSTNHPHPIRRRSLLTPGLATRDASDPLRKPPTDGRVEPSTAGRQLYAQPPATAPLDRPPPSASAGYRTQHGHLSPPLPLPSVRLDSLDLATDDGAIGTPRSSTPSERDYGRLGAHLRITNGNASPNPSVGSGRWSNTAPVPQRSHTMAETSVSGFGDHATTPQQPLKSRLYMIENADRSEEDSDESNIHPAFRSRPLDAGPASGRHSEKYSADIPESPYDGITDLNKPLPTPPGSDVKVPPNSTSSKSSVNSRSKLARPDLDCQRHESLNGDISSHQEDLYDETLSLLESIGSSHSNSSRPKLTSRTTTTTTTTTTYTTATTPSTTSYTRESHEREVQPPASTAPCTKVVSSTGPITSVVRTVATHPRKKNMVAPNTDFDQIMDESSAPSNFTPTTSYPRLANDQGQTRVALVRNNDSGYSSSSYASSQGQQNWVRPVDADHQQPQHPPRHRPSFSSSFRLASGGSSISKHTHSSSESSTTLLAIRNAVPTPLSSNKRRLKKFRPVSLPPVERIPVQGQKVQSAGFIPPVPQDIAARHAQRSAEHPPLAHTVANIRYMPRRSSFGMAPTSAPLQSLAPGRLSEEGSSWRPPAMESTEEYPDSDVKLNHDASNRPRRNSKKFFTGRSLKFADPAKSAGSDKPAPRSASWAERRIASRQQQRDVDFDEDEGAVLTDVHEVGELYGPSPYDAAASQNWAASDTRNPYWHSTAPRARSALGMTEAQASEVNRMRQQKGLNYPSEGRMIAPDRRPTLPMSAPPSEQYFEKEQQADPYSNACRNLEWDQSPSFGQHHHQLDGNHAGAQYTPPADDWQEQCDTWDNRPRAKNGQGDRHAPVRRSSGQPTHASPELHLSEWSSRRRDSGRSQTAPTSPITPMDGFDTGRGYGRIDQMYEQGDYDEGGSYRHYGGEDMPYGYEPGRYDGGFAYGYEPGRGVNGSAGTRGWYNDTSRKGAEMGQQYGIDFTDVPIFVAPRMAT